MEIPTEQETVAYYNSRPKKRIGAGVLIFNTNDQLLIVKPTYLERWLFPGGGVEGAEAPLEAAVRECKEEIGVEFADLWPAYINYISPQSNGQSDIIQFTFTTEDVDDTFLHSLQLQKEEIEDAKFVDIVELPRYFSERRAKAITVYATSRHNRATLYMENGEPII